MMRSTYFVPLESGSDKSAFDSGKKGWNLRENSMKFLAQAAALSPDGALCACASAKLDQLTALSLSHVLCVSVFCERRVKAGSNNNIDLMIFDPFDWQLVANSSTYQQAAYKKHTHTHTHSVQQQHNKQRLLTN